MTSNPLALTERLGALDAELTSTLAAAETALRALAIHVVAEVPMVTGHVLGWGRENETWIVFVRDPRNPQRTPLLKAGRVQRTAAAFALASLLDAVVRAAEIATHETSLAIASAADFTARAGGGR